MNLLKAALYDPAVAVSKSTASLLAMTAIDTTNLRLAITVPAHGMVFFRMFGGAITGATTVPTLLIGALNGATVIGRVNPQDFPGTMNAATQSCPLYAEWLATGLTPGAMNVDLAYAVQVVVASTNIKYGGPNTNAGANAWGGISFQAWDPQPMTANSTLTVDTSGRVDVSKIAGTTQTGRDLGASVLLSSGTGTGQLDFTSGVVKANLAQILGTALTETAGQIAAAFKKFFDISSPTSTMNTITAVTTTTTATNLTNAPTSGDLTATMKTSVTTAATAATPTASVSGDFSATMKTSIGTAVAASAVASVTGNVGGNVAGSVASVTAAVSVTGDLSATMKTSVTTACTASTPTAAAVTAAVTLPSIPSNWITAAGINASALNGKGDWNIGKTGYTLTVSPLDAAGVRSAVGLSSANLDTQFGTLLTAAAYTAPDNASIAAIQDKTDGLGFTVDGYLDINVMRFNSGEITGDGTEGNPWRALGT